MKRTFIENLMNFLWFMFPFLPSIFWAIATQEWDMIFFVVVTALASTINIVRNINNSEQIEKLEKKIKELEEKNIENK